MKRITMLTLAVLAATPAVFAQDYPNKPVTIISPYAPGGSGDISARFLAEGLGQMWGQPVTVENVTGGGAMIGPGRIVSSPADGYTLLVHGTSFTMVPAVRDDLPFSPASDFLPVAMVSDTQFVVVAGPSVKATNIAEFVEEGRSRQILATTSGAGTSTHFANELLASATGMNLKSVHYKGGSEAVVDVVAGRADIYVATVTSALTYIEAGQLKPLAVMGAQRLESLPDVPTLVESGIDAEVGLWWAAFAAAGTPDEIVQKLNADINTLMTSPAGVEYLASQQANHPNLTVAEFAAFVGQEFAKWELVAKAQNITLD